MMSARFSSGHPNNPASKVFKINMSSAAFYELEPLAGPLRYGFKVMPPAVIGPPDRPFMMGGVGLGSAIEALECATGRPLIWATAQFLSHAAPGSFVEISVDIDVKGRRVTQARATVSLDDRVILWISAALGGVPGQTPTTYIKAPDVPGPESFEPIPLQYPECDDIQKRFEKRRLQPSSAERNGRDYIWFRPLDPQPLSAPLLAVMADFLGSGLPAARDSTSLDNTLRIHTLEPSTWVLAETQYPGVRDEVVSGEMRLFSEGGALLATGSQTLLLRR